MAQENLTVGKERHMTDAEFDEAVVVNMPHYIATNYRTLLEATNNEQRVRVILHLYKLVLRTLTIMMVSQYLVLDKETVQDSRLDTLLLKEFQHRMTLDAWQKVLFTALQVYEGNQKLLFMPEIYDLYWTPFR
jgi:hypothetical protein